MKSKCRKIFFAFSLSALFVFTNEVVAQVKQSSLESYSQLYNNGRFTDIINLVVKIDSVKRSANDWFYLAQSYSAFNDHANSAEAFKKAVDLNPDNKGYRLMYSRVLNQNGLISDAITNYNYLINADSSFTPALSELGMIYINTKEYAKSIPLFKRLVALNSKDFVSGFYAAYALYQKGLSASDTAVFVGLVTRSMIENPRYVPAQNLWAAFLFIKEAYNQALFVYDAICELRPNDSEPYYKSGICAEKMKLFGAAIIRFKNAIELDSTVFGYYSHLGLAYYVRGKLDSAIVAYNHALALSKDNPMVYINLGMAYVNLDSLSRAKECFDKAQKFLETDQFVLVQNQLAYINLKQNNSKEAKIYCEKVLLLDPQNVYANFNLAKSFDLLGNRKAAINNYAKAIPLMENLEQLKKELEFSKQRLAELQKKDK
jgi:tetratricopeptide (TPR) repeat protein